MLAIRRLLTSTATATIITAFALSRIYCCIAVLLGSAQVVISHWQLIQNYAAKIDLLIPNSANIATQLKSIYCLHAKIRRTYKTDGLCYLCLFCCFNTTGAYE